MRAILQLFYLLAFITAGFATDPSLTDDILILYRLSPAQEAQFSDRDSVISPFWAEWDQLNAIQITRDYIGMASNNPLYAWNRCATSAFTGYNDARMTTRGAYSDKGIYLYFDVTDDQFGEPGDWKGDVVDVFVDNVSSAIEADRFSCWMVVCPTFTFKEIQLNMGNQQKPAGFNYRYYDDLARSITNHTALFSDSAYDCITMEIITVSTNRKLQEWFIPWSQIGASNFSDGTQYAFACGYNDADGDTNCVNSLTWVGLCYPNCEPPNPGAWGDMELGPCLDPNGCSNKVQNPLRRQNLLSSDMPSTGDCFSLKGERFSTAPDSKQKGRIFVREGIREDGSKRAQIQAIGAN